MSSTAYCELAGRVAAGTSQCLYRDRDIVSRLRLHDTGRFELDVDGPVRGHGSTVGRVAGEDDFVTDAAAEQGGALSVETKKVSGSFLAWNLEEIYTGRTH
jgi:hypothetical protein